jgi:phosphatidylinositol glycan class K
VLQSEDFKKVYEEMNLKSMYKEVLMFIDTCQAMSLFDGIETPNLFLVGSSVHGQSAYSNQHDDNMNLDLNDKFTFAFFEFLKGDYSRFTSKTKLSDFLTLFDFKKIGSDLRIKHTSEKRSPEELHLQEYLPLPGTKIDPGISFYNLADKDVELLQ